MAEHTDTSKPLVPVLLSPLRERVVNGHNVTFEWEPVAGATEYILEVAQDTRFENTFIEQNVGNVTVITFSDVFPTDEITFYWRVLVKTAAGWSQGEVIESFISGTNDQSEQDVARAHARAELGGDEVMQLAHQGEHADIVGVENESIDARPLMNIVAVTALILIVLVVFGFQWAQRAFVQAEAEATEMSGYPELRETELNAANLLEQYGVVSAEEGVYRIPLEEAINLMVNETTQQQGAVFSSEVQLLPTQ